MIKYTNQHTLKNRIFKTPFENKLDPNNRWMKLEQVIPWDQMAEVYMKRLDRFNGRASIDLRIVMGAMFIQYRLNLTDRETIASIQENIYMQYFVGLCSFQLKGVFDHSLLPVFRKRLGKNGSKELADIFIKYAFDEKLMKHRKSRKVKVKVKVNDNDLKPDLFKPVEVKIDHGKTDEIIDNEVKPDQDEVSSVEAEQQSAPELNKDQQNESDEMENRGTVKIDATAVPQHISYPTDTKLLNHARTISEQIIDQLYDHNEDIWSVKPRTYRKKARGKWLSFSKSRRPSGKKIRVQKKADLNYLKRNLRYIDEMMEALLEQGIVIQLTEVLRKKLYVISELYRQQKQMYDSNSKKISDRIVNVAQPWVRPIVRGKAGSPVEFGAKINISLTENMISVDQSSFDAFNESTYFEQQIESYRARFGYYPQYALVDKIYLTRKNRAYMKQNGIKHTGSPLGRRPKQVKATTRKMKKKNNERNHVEGKIGQAKLRFGLDRLRTKTKETSYCAINLIALAINMLALQKRAFCLMFSTPRSSKDRLIAEFKLKWKHFCLFTIKSVITNPKFKLSS